MNKQRREQDELGQGLYVVTTEDGFPCKVGITNDLRLRLFQLQIGNWNRLRASWFSFVLNGHWRSGKLSIWAAFNMAADYLEKEVHKTLTELDLHMSGEWFAISEEDCIAVIQKVAKDRGVKLSGIEVLQGLALYDRVTTPQLDQFKMLIKAEEAAQAVISAGHGIRLDSVALTENTT